jgi:hypothetical protein
LSKLAKQQSEITAADQPPNPSAIGQAVSMMLGAGLKTYGQEPSVDAWATVMRLRGIKAREIRSATEYFMSHGGEFPSAAEFADRALEERESREREAAMEGMAERLRQADEEALRARNMARYGTKDPTREQIDARMSEIGADVLLKSVTDDEQPHAGPRKAMHDEREEA